ncbi:Bax inhibitor-1/YccA family protein [Celerinatantimonas diazotrophica]|uniref:Modulator of FtsH protease n=1 Tax=Celerinatantimonas diazotrophica TaxID=412034 RepID=A0A4R1KGN8_9GAMM|nr:Bax inhibitor-1/YccA family protein [Celerinatantimonas diazotrophica]TCK63998.1 modulator of FtsH protease [Celerinatantimonas diazotrophica]CAG9297089.1 Modulator of FtsH protease YccA [Celerinatantimonas diazotrophica]
MNQYRSVDYSSVGTRTNVNKVLRNTYMLLALTLAFSAVVAGSAAVLMLPPPGIIITLVGFYGLLFAVEKTKNSSAGLVFVFLLTGFMGYTLGPIINLLLKTGGTQILMTALGGTALTFFALSAYVLITRKDMSFLGGMMTAGFFVILALFVASLFLHMPILYLVLSGLFILFSSGAILMKTSDIIHGGETNYISATVTIFVSLYNIFLSLLNILMAARD